MKQKRLPICRALACGPGRCQGIVFNAHYLSYVDTAMSGYWRALALPMHSIRPAARGDLFVRHAAFGLPGAGAQ